jgi:hypothetical protein
MGAWRCEVSVDRQTALARALRLPLAPPDENVYTLRHPTSNTHPLRPAYYLAGQ